MSPLWQPVNSTSDYEAAAIFSWVAGQAPSHLVLLTTHILLSVWLQLGRCSHQLCSTKAPIHMPKQG